MKRLGWNVVLGLTLVLISVLCYGAQIMLFHRPQETEFYLLQDFAFVPVQVLLVTLVINEMLSLREKNSLKQKMNMVIGAFFSEVGTDLIRSLSDFNAPDAIFRNSLAVTTDWSAKQFDAVRRFVQAHDYKIDSRRGDLTHLKRFLLDNRGFMLGLLENPNLLEHESFTELLWAVFHLTEELSHREDTTDLLETDYDHLSGDIIRAYSLLITEWLTYIEHLSQEYPYVFSLVARTNPFAETSSAEVVS